jgi:hypothetical protein
LCASFILFKGFNTTDAVNTISLLCGFLIIFTGVYLLNLSQNNSPGMALDKVEGAPSDGMSGLQTRRSMQLRHSIEATRLANGGYARGDRVGLMHNYDEENGFGLDDLIDESDDENNASKRQLPGNGSTTSVHAKAHS